MSENNDDSLEKKLASIVEEINKITKVIMHGFFERQNLMKKIAAVKNQEGEETPIFRHQREVDLMAKYVKEAKNKGVDPEMVESLMWELMSCGKKEQAKILNRDSFLLRESQPLQNLKNNLLTLTEKVAQKYDDYGDGWSATKLVKDREKECIERTIKEMGNDQTMELAIDLGCANGSITNLLKRHFNKVIGYDISPHFISEAKKRHQLDFIEYDLETGIPLKDACVDFIVANFGAASEVSSNIFEETFRVLKPNGRAFLSFYNKDAIVIQWWRPWTNAFRIMIDPINNTLDVEVESTVYKIKATPINAQEINDWAKENNLKVISVSGSNHFWDFCPKSFFKEIKLVDSVRDFEKLTEEIPPFLGQYIRTVIEK